MVATKKQPRTSDKRSYGDAIIERLGGSTHYFSDLGTFAKRSMKQIRFGVDAQAINSARTARVSIETKAPTDVDAPITAHVLTFPPPVDFFGGITWIIENVLVIDHDLL